MSISKNFPYQLYLVISEADCKKYDYLYVAERAILGGVDIIQLREKGSTTSSFIDKAIQLKKITDKYQVPLIINDNLEVAKHIDAAGIHVGNNDIPPMEIRRHWNNPSKLIGYSVEYLIQLDKVDAEASDYLGVSPVFNTATKSDTVTQWGIEGVANIRGRTQKPLVAIGNINNQNAKAIIDAGADCIAVVSAICAADNPQEAAQELKRKFYHEEI